MPSLTEAQTDGFDARAVRDRSAPLAVLLKEA